jgi:hypothetical protein
MKIILRLCFLAAVAAIGFWLWIVFFPSAESVIKKQITTVARLLTFNSKEGQIAKVANVEDLTGYFSNDIEILVDTPVQARQSVSGREDLRQILLGARMALTGLDVEFKDVTVTVAPGGIEATVNLTAQARVAGDRDSFVQEAKFSLRKIEGKWIIVKIETVRTLT